MNCRKQYSWCSLRGKLAEVALYSPACSCCCRNKRPTPDYCGSVWNLGVSVLGRPLSVVTVLLKASKVQGSSLLLSFCPILIYIYNIYIYGYSGLPEQKPHLLAST